MNWADKTRCRRCEVVRWPVPPAQHPQPKQTPAPLRQVAGRATGAAQPAAKARAKNKDRGDRGPQDSLNEA
eukprot:12916064-Prorocentrum_lima.AAC.1